MSDKDEEKIGYKSPPKKHRFEKGRSGNPKGRPRKIKPPRRDDSQAAILERAANETVIVRGEEMTLHEVSIRALQRKGISGDPRAIALLDKLRVEAGIGMKPGFAGGVLVVPGVVPIDEWTLAAARQQAPFREADYGKRPSKVKKNESTA